MYDTYYLNSRILLLKSPLKGFYNYIKRLWLLYPWVWPQWIDGSGERSTQFEVEQHIHIPQLTDTHDDIYTQTHTITYMYTQTHRGTDQNAHKRKYLNTDNTPLYKSSLGCHKRPRPTQTGSDFFNFGWAVNQNLSQSIVIGQCFCSIFLVEPNTNFHKSSFILLDL